jgi:hypothetical protein
MIPILYLSFLLFGEFFGAKRVNVGGKCSRYLEISCILGKKGFIQSVGDSCLVK